MLLTQNLVNKYLVLMLVALSWLIILTGTASVLQALVSHHTYPGNMAVNTAAAFVLLGLALSAMHSPIRLVIVISQYLLHVVTIISGLSILGYLYGLPLFYNAGFRSGMNIQTALLLFILSMTAALLHPDTGIAALFTGTRIGNKMARRVFLLIICSIGLFSALRAGSRREGWFSQQTGLSLLVICFMGLGLALIWHTANWLNRIDAKRYDAEEEIKAINETLEERVKLRSASLSRLVEKLRESELKFRAAFEHSAIGVALVSLKGKWLKVNRRLCDMVGYREQELLSMSFHDLAHPQDELAGFDISEHALKSDNAAFRVEKRYVCKNGATVWVSINVATVTNKNGGPVYFVSQYEDITERKKAELRLKRAYLEIQDHVNSIRDIAWKQSHLIRRPLANLKALVDILKDDPAEEKTLAYIQAELERLDAAIIEMAEDACNNGATEIVVKKRFLVLPALNSA